MSKLITKTILEDAAGEMTPKNKRLLKRIRRDRKLYFRDKNGTVRRLDKVAVNLYDSIMVNMLMGNLMKQYETMNKGVDDYRELKPVPLTILKKFKEDFDKVSKMIGKKSFILLTYNSSWRVICTLNIQK